MNNLNNIEVTDLKVIPCVNSRFIQPSRVSFKQNGRPRCWDYIKIHDSVSILIYNSTRQAIVLVKQFRPAVYMNRNRILYNEQQNKNENKEVVVADQESVEMVLPVSSGVTYELCAGIIDKNNVSLASIAKQEILEECGYQVEESDIVKVTSCYHGVGVSGSVQTTFYVEVTDDQKVSEGGGNPAEAEIIELFYLPVADIKTFIYDETKPKPPGLVFALLWFLQRDECPSLLSKQ